MDIVEILKAMYFTAKDVIRYGCENAGICDLGEEVAERLDIPVDDVIDPKSDEMREMVEAEMQKINDDVNEAARKIMDELDRLDPDGESFREFVDGLDTKRRNKLSDMLEDDLSIDHLHPDNRKNASTFVLLAIAYYALSMDNEPIDNISYAIDNFLEDDDDDMDESVSRRSRVNRCRKNNESKKNPRRRAIKLESHGEKRWFVLDLQGTEECASLEDAIEKAKWWIQLEKDMMRDFDDDEVMRWYREGDHGLDSGDVEVYEVDADDEDILDYNDRVSGRLIRRNYDPVEVFSGFKITREEAEKRGLLECRKRKGTRDSQLKNESKKNDRIRRVIECKRHMKENKHR